MTIFGQLLYWLLIAAMCLFCWRSCTYRISEQPRDGYALDLTLCPLSLPVEPDPEPAHGA
jgi:hypothetical protein